MVIFSGSSIAPQATPLNPCQFSPSGVIAHADWFWARYSDGTSWKDIFLLPIFTNSGCHTPKYQSPLESAYDFLPAIVLRKSAASDNV